MLLSSRSCEMYQINFSAAHVSLNVTMCISLIEQTTFENKHKPLSCYLIQIYL